MFCKMFVERLSIAQMVWISCLISFLLESIHFFEFLALFDDGCSSVSITSAFLWWLQGPHTTYVATWLYLLPPLPYLDDPILILDDKSRVKRSHLYHVDLSKSGASLGPSTMAATPRTNGCVHLIEQCYAMGSFIFISFYFQQHALSGWCWVYCTCPLKLTSIDASHPAMPYQDHSPIHPVLNWVIL